MIPLKDNIPTTRFAVVTAALIAINLAFFAWQLSFSGSVDSQTDAGLRTLGLSPRDENSIEYGAIPYRVTHPGKECAAGVTSSESGQEATVVCEGTDDYREAQDLAAGDPQSFPLVQLDEPPWIETAFTSMFMHGGILHIAFNMLFLWVF